MQFFLRYGTWIFFLTPVFTQLSFASCPNVSPASEAQCPSHSIRVTDHAICPGIKDNAEELIKLRDRLVAQDPKPHRIFCFPYSQAPYRYSNNRWINGLWRITILGNHSTFQNISQKPAHQDTAPFGTKLIQQDWGDLDATMGPNPQLYVIHQGLKILKTARVGENTLQLGSMIGFAVGDPLLIAGFSQQYGGFPLNARYFEFNEITNRVGNTLTLKFPLKNTYAIDTWETDYGGFEFGKPRVFQLRRPNYNYPESIQLKDIRFLSNPYATAGDALAFSAKRVILDGIEGNFPSFHVFPRETVYTEITNSIIGGAIEVDKQNEHVVIRNSTVKGLNLVHAIKSGTSCNKLLIEKNKIYNRINVVSKYLLIKENEISLSSDPTQDFTISFYNGTWGGLDVKIEDNQFKLSGKQQILSNDLVDRIGSEFAIQSISQKTAKLTAPFSTLSSSAFYYFMALYPGSLLYGKNGSVPIAKVARFGSNPQNNLVVYLDLLDNFTAASLKSEFPLRSKGFQKVTLSGNSSFLRQTR